MKRFFSLVLSAVLLATLGVPARAAEENSADQRLAQVTAKVKKVLDIGDEYTSFHGELRENELAPVWDLEWSRETDRISVTAAEDGKVLRYYFFEENTPASSQSVSLAFPAVSREEAQRTAEAFLGRVLDPALESAAFEGNDAARLNSGVYRFSGQIQLNGLPSPLSFSLTLRSSDGKITRFSRDNLEENVIGGVPSAKAAASQEEAANLLRGTLALRLEYVLNEDGSAASLRYLPEAGDSYYVDAQTGQLVNLTELYEAANRGENGAAGGTLMDSGDAAKPEAAAPNGDGLSQAELEGVAKLEGVQSKEALDGMLREITGLGLERYALASAGYSLDQETGNVTASLTYARREGEKIWRRTVACDAKTGALVSVHSSAPYGQESKAAVSQAEAQQTAKDFLAELWGGEFASCALYESRPWDGESWNASHAFTFAQQENGYFLASNYLDISVDVTDGSISRLYRQWTDGVAFDSAEGILGEDDALEAWFSHYEQPLAYAHVPVRLDLSQDLSPLAETLMDMGYTYFYALKLAYALQEPAGRSYSGVDAKTGEVVSQPYAAADAPLTYDDIDGHWAAQQLETLAQYGVGWSGGSCQPRQELTQIDLVALLASTAGYRYDPDADDADSLYRQAYSLGILTPAARQDSARLTRGAVVRMLLDYAGYSGVAKLEGIFTCSFADREEIPQELLGYAALAQGLGIVTGRFDAGRTATRAEAAVMLYNFMSC